jgi:hypothetical protein
MACPCRSRCRGVAVSRKGDASFVAKSRKCPQPSPGKDARHWHDLGPASRSRPALPPRRKAGPGPCSKPSCAQGAVALPIPCPRHEMRTFLMVWATQPRKSTRRPQPPVTPRQGMDLAKTPALNPAPVFPTHEDRRDAGKGGRPCRPAAIQCHRPPSAERPAEWAQFYTRFGIGTAREWAANAPDAGATYPAARTICGADPANLKLKGKPE